MFDLRHSHQTPIQRAASGLVRAHELAPPLAGRVCELVGSTERYAPAAVLAAAAPGTGLKWIVSGWACEARVLGDGRRQIFSFAVPGDVVRPANSHQLRTLFAITAVECVDVVETLARASEREKVDILAAMNRAFFQNAERRYEHISRLGRRSALHRTAHLLMELHDRLDQVGMVDGEAFALPLTQEDMADALGLSVVHVNRSLRTLRESGLATLRYGRVTQFERDRLQEICV